MRLANCKNCNKVFRTETLDLCEDCRYKEQSKINKIRDFVEAHHNKEITVELISERTKVDITEIYNLFKKGKLICLNETVKLKCQVCGAPIIGRTMFCNKCKNNIQSCIDSMAEDKKSAVNTKAIVSKIKSSRDNFQFGFKKDF